MRWGVFGRFRGVTTGSFIGAVWIWVSGLTPLKAIKVLHGSTHTLVLRCRRRHCSHSGSVRSLRLYYPANTWQTAYNENREDWDDEKWRISHSFLSPLSRRARISLTPCMTNKMSNEISVSHACCRTPVMLQPSGTKDFGLIHSFPSLISNRYYDRAPHFRQPESTYRTDSHSRRSRSAASATPSGPSGYR